MSYICHYSIIQSSFTALKILYALHIISPSLPQSVETTHVFLPLFISILFYF